MKNARLEIRINQETKEQLMLLAGELMPTGTVTELLHSLISDALHQHRGLIHKLSKDKPLVNPK